MTAALGRMLKAIYAGLAAALTGVSSALVGAHSFAAVSDAQWVTVGVLALGALGAVYGVSNTAPAPAPAPITVPPAADRLPPVGAATPVPPPPSVPNVPFREGG